MDDLASHVPATRHDAPSTAEVVAVGLSRRELLRRGAIVGGSVLAVQSLGTVAAFAQTSAPPPPPTEPPPPPPEPTDHPPEPSEPSSEPSEPSSGPTARPTTTVGEGQRPTEAAPATTHPGRSGTTGGRRPRGARTATARSSGTSAPSPSGATSIPQPDAPVAAAAPGELAHTGMSLSAMMGLGAGAITAGAAAVRSGHRTRATVPAHEAEADATDVQDPSDHHRAGASE